MNTVKLKSYLSFFIKTFVRRILSSNLCIRNNYLRRLFQQRSLTKVKRYERKYKDGLIRPETIEIELTNMCNMDCVFCPNSSHQRKRGVMTFETLKNIVKGMENFNIREIVIGGFGEPLLDKEIIAKLNYLYEHSKAKGISLVTNGSLLTKKLLDNICNKKLISSIDVSIDAADRKTYMKIHNSDALDKIIENLSRLKQIKNSGNLNRPYVCVRFKNFPLNRGEFSRFVNIFSQIADNVRTYVNIFQWPTASMLTDYVQPKDVIMVDNAIKIICQCRFESVPPGRLKVYR